MSKNEHFCYILRGISGSGKSTKVRKILKEYKVGHEGHVFSTDDYFIPSTRDKRKTGEHVDSQDETDEYRKNWHGSKLYVAHAKNLSSFKYAIDNGVTPVIVDNTNLDAKSCQAYVKYADKAEYKIKIVEPDSEWWREYSYCLKDKRNHPKELEELARILASKNSHGVPLDTIRKMIAKWQPNVSVDDILKAK